MELYEAAAQEQRLIDISLIGTLDTSSHPMKLHQAQGGPIVFEFERTVLLLEQPIGREEIVISPISADQWMATHEDPEFEYVLFSIFEMACYRLNSFDTPPLIQGLTTYVCQDGTISGMLINFSTGGTIGIDASSDEGLRYFYDDQTAIFEREVADITPLNKQVLWSS